MHNLSCIGLAAEHVVHEARSAGHFIPGRGQFPVEKIPEKELGLLQHPNSLDTNEVAKGGPPAVVETPAAMPMRKETPANTPAVVDTAGKGPGDDDCESLPTIPGFIDDSQNDIPPTQVEDSQQQGSSGIPVEETQGARIRREKSTGVPRGRDPSPSRSVGSLASGPSSSSRKTSQSSNDKYAKYKDGSYWKFLGSAMMVL